MLEYLEKYPPFGAEQRLPDEKILELVNFSLLKEWQEQFISQGFNSATQGLMELVDLCECLENYEENFQTQGERNHKKKSVRRMPQIYQVGANQRVKPGSESLGGGCKQKKTKKKN